MTAANRPNPADIDNSQNKLKRKLVQLGSVITRPNIT